MSGDSTAARSSAERLSIPDGSGTDIDRELVGGGGTAKGAAAGMLVVVIAAAAVAAAEAGAPPSIGTVRSCPGVAGGAAAPECALSPVDGKPGKEDANEGEAEGNPGTVVVVDSVAAADRSAAAPGSEDDSAAPPSPFFAAWRYFCKYTLRGPL